MDSRLDLFAATPPLESLRLLCSLCASNQAAKRPYRLMTIDVKRAYFYARSRRPVYIEIPIEDFEPGDEDNVAKLNLSLYGTRDAAQNWAKEYTAHLISCGFEIGASTPCHFHHKEKELHVAVHGDDFTVVGPADSLKWLQRKMSDRYETKSEFLGPDSGMEKEIRVLNRTLHWQDAGITYEPDQRHADLIIQEMGISKGKAVGTPIIPDTVDQAHDR